MKNMSGSDMLVTVNPTAGDRQVREAEVAVLEKGEWHERLVLGARLRPDEDRHHDHTGDDQHPHGDGAPDGTPVVVLGLLQTEHDQEQAHGTEDHARDVEAVRVRRKMRHEDPRHHERDDADGHVDEEDPLPTEAVHEQAAGERADKGRDTGSGAPQSHGGAAPIRWEGACDDRHGLRSHERRTEALHRAGDDQQLERARQPAPERGEGEDHEPDEVDPLRTETVAEAPRDQQRHRVGEQVRARDPHHVVEVVRVGIERRLDRRVGHRDDRGVDEDHEEPDHERPQGGPRASRGGRRGGCRARGGAGAVGHDLCASRRAMSL
jgi:hypothetical protein